MEKSKKKSYFIRRLKLFFKRNYATLIAMPVIFALAYYALKIEPDSLRITRYTFYHEKVTPELDNTLIVLIADLHTNTRRQALWQKVVERLNSLPADTIILQAGDLVNGNGKGLKINEILKKLKMLKNPSRIYSVPGNHEYRYRHGGFKAIRNAFTRQELTLLQDQNLIINTTSGGKFNLVGLDFMRNPHRRMDKNRTEKLFRDDMLNIVLTHTPEDLPYLPTQAHLTLSGHTHGGQIHIPLLGSVINPPGYPRKYSYGKVVENNKTLLVTSGLGSAYTQARFCMPPEIVFITLKMPNKK